MSFRRKRDEFEFPSEQVEASPKKAREFARRMVVDGIMPFETISRLTGLSPASVRELAARITMNSDKDS